MEYQDFANEYFNKMILFHQLIPQRKIDGAIRGEVCVLQYLHNKKQALPGELSSFMNISTAKVAAVLYGTDTANILYCSLRGTGIGLSRT